MRDLSYETVQSFIDSYDLFNGYKIEQDASEKYSSGYGYDITVYSLLEKELEDNRKAFSDWDQNFSIGTNSMLVFSEETKEEAIKGLTMPFVRLRVFYGPSFNFEFSEKYRYIYNENIKERFFLGEQSEIKEM